MSNGKGSDRRPLSVSRAEFSVRWDAVFSRAKKAISKRQRDAGQKQDKPQLREKQERRQRQ